MITFDLTILGTSSALPTSKRYPTAQVLNIRERFFLLDCGEGTQIQIRKYGVKLSCINHIFISHLHGDHYFGLIGLLSTFALLGRKNDLHIYSHSELPEILKNQIEFLDGEIAYKIVWHPLNFKKPHVLIDDETVTVMSFPVKHRIACCGFLFTEKEQPKNIIREQIAYYKIPVKELQFIKAGADFVTEEGTIIPNSWLTLPAKKPRSFAFCTDTIYLPELSDILQGVSVLYHEATYDRTLEKRASETFHSTAMQAAMQAKQSNVGQLVIGHFSARYKNVSSLLSEAREVFENTITAEEGLKISIQHKESF
jgi:ribonuclease Z